MNGIRYGDSISLAENIDAIPGTFAFI